MKRLMLVVALALAGTASAADKLLLNGAGATFPFPLYSKWFSEYNKLHPEYQFNYQSIGSGGGIQQVTNKTVDFGASDAPMKDAQLAAAPGTVHIPTVLGAVVVTYNGAADGLRLSPDALAAIYLGKITRWNDPALATLNPGVKLPDTAINVVHRSDGSGTTNIFTDYLSKVSAEWKSQVGASTSVKWPVGLGGKGNEGVTGLVKQTPGAIGYVELAYAMQNNISIAQLQNAAGKFLEPSLSGTTRAAEGVDLPDDMKVTITNSSNPDAYPVVGFTWLLVYANQTDRTKGEALVKMLLWAIHDGQKYAEPLIYAGLAPAAVKKAEAQVLSIKCQGQTLISP